MSGFRKDRPLRPFTWLFLLGAVAFAAGCSTANDAGGGSANHVLPSGSSVPGWTVPAGGSQHAISATQEFASAGTLGSCTECHGTDLRGGISQSSCFGNSTGCHHGTIPGWAAAPPAIQNHGVWAKRAIGDGSFFACQICHGSDFSGGGAQVTCFNNAACHGAGVFSPHPPAPWRGASTYTHVDTNTANARVCAQCHFPGSPNNPPNHPPAPAPAGTAPGCFNSTLCHGEVAHAVPFNATTHFSITSATFTADCGNCHAVTGTSPESGAPLCTTCHVAASPLTAVNCTSCHASPPSGGAPAGAAYPNVPGAHATHIALNSAGSPISCDTCHNGLGTNTLNHYNRANARPGSDAQRLPPGDAAFPATYDAQTGASSFDNAALSCSNVGCHGGQATPNWQTGVLVVNDQCTACHVSGTTQFNSYASGEHTFHVNLFGAGAATCTLCHDTAALAVDHFTTLADNSISPAVASATIGGPFITTWTAGAGTSGTCNATCHPGDRAW